MSTPYAQWAKHNLHVADRYPDWHILLKATQCPQVQDFYQAFGQFVGNKLESLGQPDAAFGHQGHRGTNTSLNYLP